VNLLALDQRAEKAYADLGGERQQQICEKIFKALTDGTDARGIRRPTGFATLCALADASLAEVMEVIDIFRKPSRLFVMPKANEPNVGRRRLMGAYAAGGMGWGTLPRPHIGNRRARFYFTEAGWHKIGRAILMDARRRGIMIRVVRLKNPPLSQVIYRDKWQVAILPPWLRRKGSAKAE
jgi:hypothetical protein